MNWLIWLAIGWGSGGVLGILTGMRMATKFYRRHRARRFGRPDPRPGYVTDNWFDGPQ